MTRSRIAAALVVLILAVGVGGYVVYDQILRGDSIAPLALPSSAPTATGAAGAAASSDPAASGDPASSSDPSASIDGDVAGTWTVTTGSQAGYRVREQLANLPAESDAVGRTDQITGTITVTSDGTTSSLTAGTLQVDTTTIASDKPMRDNRLRGEGLQTDSYPTASFADRKSTRLNSSHSDRSRMPSSA